MESETLRIQGTGDNLITSKSPKKLLTIRKLRTYFYVYRGVVKASDGINLEVDPGTTYGLVGETGCGKTVTGLSILRLIRPPGRIVEGEVIFEGQDLLKKNEKEMRSIRGRKISMIFQEPMTALNPVFTIGSQLRDVIKLHQKLNDKEAWEKAIEALKLVNMPNPELLMKQYSFQLSGGMRQRAMIAIAVSCNPNLLIADEPTTALDVTIQAWILKLIDELRRKLNLSMILIAHNLGLIYKMCDRTAIMYAGQIVEDACTQDLFKNPKHPYTQGLIEAVPSLSKKRNILPSIQGSVPSLINPPLGCRFNPRCSHRMKICEEQEPLGVEIHPGHRVYCHAM